MSQEESTKLNDKLKEIFVNPSIQSKVVDSIVGNKPSGWSRRSNAPYYRRQYGLEIKEVFDRMIKDQLDSCYDFATFEAKGINRSTLYIRINQSIRYLLDHLDDINHTYARFREMIRIERERGVGVMIRFAPEFRGGNINDFKPREIIPKDKVPSWKEEMLEYMENGTVGEPFFVDKLALTNEEVTDLKTSLIGLKNILSSITSHSVKLVKINPPEEIE